jgi:hypothetical protein
MQKIRDLFNSFLRGFAYQGFQCQRCDCVVHSKCYNGYACPCKGKKYPNVKFIFHEFIFKNSFH